MPLSFLFIYAGILGRGNRQACPTCWPKSGAHGDGEFLVSSVPTGDVSEQGILRRFGLRHWRQCDARLQHHFELLPHNPHRDHRILSLAPGLSLSSMGNLLGVFLLIRLELPRLRRLGGDRQRHQHDAGNPDINQIIWFASCFFPA